MPRTHIVGVGAYVPQRRLTNHDLARMMDTTDEWIFTRTGIRERRIAAPDESTSDMALHAARQALASAGLSAGDLDLIVVCTCTPDMAMPSTAALVQGALGAVNAACLDLNAACTGFVYGLHVVRGLIESGLHRHALLIGADKMSMLMDYQDRNVSVLFGDGAGAVVLTRGEDGGKGVLSSTCRADGTQWNLITVPAGGSRKPLTADNIHERLQFMKMQGKEVFRMAVRHLQTAIADCIRAAGLTPADVHWVIPHQANARLVEAVVERIHFTMEQTIMNIERFGNTSAASIPLAWAEGAESGRVKPGQRLLVAGMGAGMTWGAAVVQV